MDYIWVVRGGATPLEYARGAGKNRGKIAGGGTPPSLKANQVSWWR